MREKEWEKEKLLVIFPTVFSKDFLLQTCKTQGCFGKGLLTFSKQQILDSTKSKEFADNSFKFGEIGGKFSERAREHFGERKNCLISAISPFSTVFL